MAFQRLIRMRPPRVLETETRSCWSAALQSWVEASADTPDAAEGLDSGAARRFGDFEFPDRSISERGLERLALDAGMAHELGDAARLITPRRIHRLLELGHVYLSYAPSLTDEAGGHTVVVYGVDASGIAVMDPCIGYLYRDFGYFRGCRRAFVGWPGESWRQRLIPAYEAIGRIS